MMSSPTYKASGHQFALKVHLLSLCIDGWGWNGVSASFLEKIVFALIFKRRYPLTKQTYGPPVKNLHMNNNGVDCVRECTHLRLSLFLWIAAGRTRKQTNRAVTRSVATGRCHLQPRGQCSRVVGSLSEYVLQGISGHNALVRGVGYVFWYHSNSHKSWRHRLLPK